MTTGNIITVELLWGCLWRAIRHGVLLGAGLGGFYAAALGTFLFLPILGTVLGFLFGALVGAVLGVPLGLLAGLLLSWLAISYQSLGHSNPRRLAGIVCVAGTFLALLADWTLHGLPDPDGFAVFRVYLLGFEPIFTRKYLQTGVPLGAVSVSMWVFAPTLIALVASWLTGRHVATWYLGKVTKT
jgi:hypothetical protein